MNLIDLHKLLELHGKITNRRHKLILLDVFYLCLNKSFQQSVSDFRQELLKKAKELKNADFTIPSKNLEMVGSLRKNIHESNLWKWYKDSLWNIAESHYFYDPSFTEDLLSKYIEENGESLTLPEIAFEDLNILENIIFLNTPLTNTDENGIPLRPRAGSLSIESDIYGPYIKGKFDLNVSKTTIETIVDKTFDNIKAEIEEEYKIPKINRHQEENLAMKYKLSQLEGKTLEQKALVIESEGLYKGKDMSLDAVRLNEERIEKGISRFDKRTT